jgi:glycosyltransferase involved in cell wall biosynthesis
LCDDPAQSTRPAAPAAPVTQPFVIKSSRNQATRRSLRLAKGLFMPLTLSFVIPAYNEAETIGACLRSIIAELERTSQTAEIIVVDNASTDETAQVAASFDGVIVVSEPRKGITFARQAGFIRSSGQLVANIDADARLPKGWLDTVTAEYQRNPSLVCLSGPQRYDDASFRIRVFSRLFYHVAYVTYLANRWVLRKGSMAQGGNFICRSDALRAIGGFDTSITFFGEDTDVAQRLSRVGDVKFTLSLPIVASARRLDTEGLVKTAVVYSINYLWVIFRGRPFTDRWTDVRPSRG